MIYKLEEVALKGVKEMGVQYYIIRYVYEKMDGVILTTNFLKFESTIDKHILPYGTEEEIIEHYKLY